MDTLMQILLENFKEILVTGAIMVSAIIIFIGFLKPILFNKIRCKPIRRILLALSDILFSFAATAIYFVIEGFPWTYYWQTSVGVTCLCIVVYWFYENTCLRDLIGKIGTMAVKKFFKVFLMIFDDKDKQEIQQELDKISGEVRKYTEEELSTAVKKVAEDKDFINL